MKKIDLASNTIEFPEGWKGKPRKKLKFKFKKDKEVEELLKTSGKTITIKVNKNIPLQEHHLIVKIIKALEEEENE